MPRRKNVASDFANQFPVPMECPGCENAFDIPLKTMATKGAIVTCPSCNAEIELEPTEEIKREYRQMNRKLK